MDSLYAYESPSMSMSNHSPMINYRKDAKKGVRFTFMVAGELGTGKTTFINSLLNKKVISHRFESDPLVVGDTKTLTFTSAKSVALPSTSILTRSQFDPSNANEEPGIALTETKIEMVDDDNMKLLLNIIDTPGFGENLNNEICFIEIENYLRQQFDLVLGEETRIKRNPRFTDTRVHVLLYFITPTGHGLRELDINCMKRLSKYVNIIPVIGKADSFTEKELLNFKNQIKTDIEKFNVPIFQFDNYLNEYDEDEDYELIQECKFLSRLQPFAIISSEDDYEVKDINNGETKTIKGRKYPWGLVDINNPQYSDFPILKSVILGSHLQDLKDLTHDFLYETYRTERLTKVTGKSRNNHNNHENDDDYENDGEFHDTVEQQHHNGNGYLTKDQMTVPSLSNLAQLTSANTTENTADNDSLYSGSSSNKKGKSSMLLEAGNESSDDLMPSPRLKDSSSFNSSTSTISLDNNSNLGGPPRNSNQQNSAFKRLSIAPQRNQLRQISETVPYVLRHERILERQQKLEELEMASAKELANRAAALEQKAAALKLKEKSLMARVEADQLRRSNATSPESHKTGQTNYDDDDDDEIPLKGNESIRSSMIKKDETLTDLNSVVEGN